MKQMHAVVGFLPDGVAKALGSRGYKEEQVNVRMEHGSDETHVAIRAADVLGVLSGASQKGETAVQVFLKDDAKVDSVTSSAISEFLRPIRDFSFFKFRPPINVIYYDPRLVEKLIQLSQETVK